MTRSRRRRRRREAVAAILPNLLTLGNAACGFGAIVHIANIVVENDPIRDLLRHHNIYVAVLLILAANIFDMLDGRVARMTSQTSDLGAQLDSLSDAISFGVAPAFLVWRVVHLIPLGQAGHLPSRLGWALALLYLCCAVLRLARFNVETDEDDAHDTFEGLPTPGAAGAVVAPFLLLHEGAGSMPPWLLVAVVYVIPIWAACIGALMVSRVPYVHFVNWLLKGKKPFARLVEVIFALALVAAFPYWAAAGGFVVFALTGPAVLAWRWAFTSSATGTKGTEQRPGSI